MSPQQIEAYVDAAASALALPLSAAQRPGVLRFFALAAGFAEIVEAVPLHAHDDSALSFVPLSAAPSEADMPKQPGAGEESA
jgi:hypothetical protein